MTRSGKCDPQNRLLVSGESDMRSGIMVISFAVLGLVPWNQQPAGKDQPTEAKKFMGALFKQSRDRDPKVRAEAYANYRDLCLKLRFDAQVLASQLQEES